MAATYTNSVTQEVFLSIAYDPGTVEFAEYTALNNTDNTSWFQEAYITVITKKTSQICYELKPELGLDKDPLKLNGLPLLIYMQLLFSSHC